MTRRRRHGQAGNALIEMALILPLLLVVFAGIVDLSLAFQRYEVLTNAVREGARIAVLPGYSDADVQARVTQYITEGLGAGAVSSLNFPSGENGPIDISMGGGATMAGYQVTAQLNHSYLILGPLVSLVGGSGFSSVTLTARSTMRLEAGG